MNSIQVAVDSLIGLKLSVARRAADMRGFHFGEMREGRRGGTVGQYALHVQCPWRIEGPDGIITGRSDLWEPVLGELAPDDWRPGLDDNVQDLAIAKLLGGFDPATGSHVNNGAQLVVESAQASSIGDLVLHLSGGYRLTIFPAGFSGEAWRIFQPDTDMPHLVVKGNGVELV